MTIPHRILALALAAALLGSVAACGDEGSDRSGRPTEDELSIKLRNDAGFPPTPADCVAEILVGSDVSDAGLNDLMDTDFDPEASPFNVEDFSTADQKAMAALAEDLAACLPGGQGGTTAPATAPADTAGTTAPTDTTAPTGTTGTTAPTDTTLATDTTAPTDTTIATGTTGG